MMQENLTVGTKRRVRRRPLLVTARDVEDACVRYLDQRGADVGRAPAHWDRAAPSGAIDVLLVDLVNTTSEYKKVESLFKRTLAESSFRIVTIKRVQNLELWDAFQRKREWLRKKNGGVDVAEKSLFHGTTPDCVVPISQQNIDWRMHDAQDTNLGKGSYFARDASCVHKNSIVSADGHASSSAPARAATFLVRVLVGRYIRGDPSYVRPPEVKRPDAANASSPAVFYDSCVNTETDPSIFVVFEKDQIYPEYVIDYEY